MWCLGAQIYRRAHDFTTRMALALGALTLALATGGCSQPPSPGPSTTSSPTSDEPRVSDGEEWLLYQRYQDDEFTIRLVRPDGTGDHAVVSAADSPGKTTHPDWSPDGQQVVFTVDDSQLWTVRVDGTGLEQLPVDCGPECYLLDSPAWSPDGRSIAYVHVLLPAGGVPTTTIESVDVVTGEVSVLYTQPDPLQLTLAARWAPSGDAMVLDLFRYDSVDSSSPNGTAIATLDLKTRQVTRITPWEMFGTYPDWSPDGTTIVFTTYDLGDRDAGNGSNPYAASDLYTIAPDGSALTQLTKNPTGDTLIRNNSASGPLSSQPTWAPSGDSIVFVQVEGETWPGWGMASIVPGDPEPTPAAGDGFLLGTHPRLRPLP